MKKIKIMIIIFLSTMSLHVIAGSMGDFLALSEAIKHEKSETARYPCKKEILTLSDEVLKASNQSIAETIMLMMEEARRKNRPIFCPPKGFSLSGDIVAKLMLHGYEESTLSIDKKNTFPAVTFVILELHRAYPCVA